MIVFLSDTEWLVRKCGVFDTQAIESWNAIKAKLCPKHLSFQKSFSIRCLLAIEKWNNGTDWYEILEEQLLVKQDEINHTHSVCVNHASSIAFCDARCKYILKQDEEKLTIARMRSHDIKIMKMRNAKRRLYRLQNRISPAGHQYAGDLGKTKNEEDAKERVKRIDPTRKVALCFLPNITNTHASNCFINSLLQLLKKTCPEKNCALAPTNKFKNSKCISNMISMFRSLTFFAHFALKPKKWAKWAK